MTDELIDVININDQVIDQQMKSVVHEKGLRHRVSAILVQNSAGKYLIPTASEIKVNAGGLFHSAAGHVPSGETYEESAKRELWEETGLKSDVEDFESLGVFWLDKEYPTRIEKERFQVFRIGYSKEMGEIRFNEEQGNEQWLSEQELREIYMSDPERLSYPLSLTCKFILKF